MYGMGGSVEDWVLSISALAERHRVYALDLIGFGRCDEQTPIRLTIHPFTV